MRGKVVQWLLTAIPGLRVFIISSHNIFIEKGCSNIKNTAYKVRWVLSVPIPVPKVKQHLLPRIVTSDCYTKLTDY